MTKSLPIAALCFVLCTACVGATDRDENDDPVVSPRQQALTHKIDALRAARATSSDLRLRILYSMSGEFEEERRPEDNGFYGKEKITAAALYEQARGSTDPLALDLLLQRCGFQTKTMKACDRLALARRWTEADSQNQVAWLALAAVQRQTGDLATARETFRRAALASTWHEDYGDIADLVARSIPGDLATLEREAALIEALGMGSAGSDQTVLYTLWTYCKEGELRAPCGRIVETMARDTRTLLASTMSIRYAVKAGLDRGLIVAYQQRVDAMNWAQQWMTGPGLDMDVADDPDPAATVDLLQRLIASGERRVTAQVLAVHGIDEREAARLRVAKMTDAERAHRAAILQGR